MTRPLSSKGKPYRTMLHDGYGWVLKEDADAVRAERDRLQRRDSDGQRLYVLLAYFDKRDGSHMSDMVQAAREGWERSHPDMGEDTAWDEFDRLWEHRNEDR